MTDHLLWLVGDARSKAEESNTSGVCELIPISPKSSVCDYDVASLARRICYCRLEELDLCIPVANIAGDEFAITVLLARGA